MSTIGADLASLDAIRSIAQETGELATTTAQEAGRAATQAADEVDDVTVALRSGFDATMHELVVAAEAADQKIASGAWQGSAREQAVAASADFRASITTLEMETTTAITAFNDRLLARTSTMQGELTTRYTSLMNQAFQSFQSFATAVNAYGNDLTAADQSVRYL